MNGMITLTARLVARFMKDGDVIERNGVLYRVVGRPVVGDRVYVTLNNVEDDTCELVQASIHSEVWVQLYDLD